jgi:hypothetical protein
LLLKQILNKKNFILNNLNLSNKVNETKLKESQNKQIEELKFKMKSEYSLIKEENDKNIDKVKTKFTHFIE